MALLRNCVGHIDLRAQAKMPSARRSDTPKSVRDEAFDAEVSSTDASNHPGTHWTSGRSPLAASAVAAIDIVRPLWRCLVRAGQRQRDALPPQPAHPEQQVGHVGPLALLHLQ